MFEEARRAEPVFESLRLEEVVSPDTSELIDGSSVLGVEEVKAAHTPVDGALGDFADGACGWVVLVMGGCDERL